MARFFEKLKLVCFVVRNDLMEANREKNANKAEADKYKKLAQELEDR